MDAFRAAFGPTSAPAPLPGERGVIRFDGALLDEFKLMHGVWEAKNTREELTVETGQPFRAGLGHRPVLRDDGSALEDCE